MKTSLAIVLATIALTFGAMLSFTPSSVAAPLSGKSPGVSPVEIVQVLLPPGPGPYRGNR